MDAVCSIVISLTVLAAIIIGVMLNRIFGMPILLAGIIGPILGWLLLMSFATLTRSNRR